MLETVLQLATSWILPGLFFWAVLSLLASTIMDWSSSFLGWKAQYLENGVSEMLGGTELAKTFFEHPLILASARISNTLGKSSRYKTLPQQIPSRVFAQIVLSWVLAGSIEAPAEFKNEILTISKLKENLFNLGTQYSDLGRTLNVIFASAGIDRTNVHVDEVLVKAQQNLQNWFDDSMEEVANRYRVLAQIATMIIGIFLAFALNFDLVGITVQLWINATQGPILQKLLDNSLSSENAVLKDVFSIVEEIQALNKLPIGWDATDYRYGYAYVDMVSKVFGLLAGGITISIGAQYGHDLLGKKKSA